MLKLRLGTRCRTLASPAQNAQRRWTERQSAIITLEDDAGCRGQGEAAPLPDFSPDTLAACQAALSRLELGSLPERAPESSAVESELARASAALPIELPAARTALESALLDLWSRQRGLPAWALLRGSATPPARRALNALLPALETSRADARAAVSRGLRTLKLKIGRAHGFAAELAALRELRREFGGNIQLRADANRGFGGAGIAELQALARADLELEFVEEPVPLLALRQLTQSPIPLALDESLLELTSAELAQEFVDARRIRALVLKPTLLGGIARTLALARRAENLGVSVVLSHAFEGPVGFATACTLALAVGSEAYAHGLDPWAAGLDAALLPSRANGWLVPWLEPGFGAAAEHA